MGLKLNGDMIWIIFKRGLHGWCVENGLGVEGRGSRHPGDPDEGYCWSPAERQGWLRAE